MPKNLHLDNDTRKGAGQEGFNFKAKLLCNVKPNLLWIPKSETLDYSTLSQDQIINHFQSSKCFTTKAGLCTLVEDVHWFTDVDPNSFIPRCYRLREIYDREKFIDDFRQTAARGILKRVSNSDPKWLAEKTTDKGSVHTDIILKSIEICETYLNQLEHNDIDQERSKPKPPRYWEEFLSDYYRVIE
ncbi:tubulin monoglycylase TTLL3-like [Xenopus tropicalis]|uniref:Tubulin monoglycylase TTLL3-like n=1 Tax=Xenopus tropicalis TaxID=8364 RepID=A0A8J1JPT0_XENTR|nr:tubulin monoglycylase TTLL3-like [Xenopus tropicalis]